MKNIDKLIQNLKGQDELMSLDNVTEMTATSIASSGFSWVKYVSIFGTVAAIITIAFIFSRDTKSHIKDISQTSITETVKDYQPSRENIDSDNAKEIIIEAKEESDSNQSVNESKDPEPEQNKSLAINSSSHLVGNVPTTPLPTSPLIKKQTRAHITPSATLPTPRNQRELNQAITPLKSKNHEASTTPITSQKILDNVIILTTEELEKFHIYQHDDVLLYSRFDEARDNLFELLFQKKYGSRSTRTGNYKRHSMTEDHPILISAPKAMFYLKRDKEVNNILTKSHIPIYVPFDRNGRGYCVFWFTRTNQNINKLDDKQKAKLDLINLDHSTIFNDTSNIQSMVKDPFKALVKQTAKKPYLTNQLFHADDVLLKNLYVKITDDKIRYSKKRFWTPQLTSYHRDSLVINTTLGPGFTPKKMRNTPPSFITSQNSKSESAYLRVSELSSINKQKTNSHQYFQSHKHKMLAVRLGEIDGDEIIFWYENTHRLLELLQESDKKRALDHLKFSKGLDIPNTPGKIAVRELMFDQMDKFKALKELSINPVRLSEDQLAKLNISSSPGSVSYSLFNVNDNLTLNFNFTKRLSTTSFIPQTGFVQSKNISPKYVSDKYGKSYRLKITSDTGSSMDLEELIPIYISANEEYHLSDYISGYSHPDCIFWYEPTEEFLNQLPKDIKEQLEFELALIHPILSPPTPPAPDYENNNQPKKESCVYLDPCSDIKTNITDMQLFPNPASGRVNVKITLNTSVSGDLTVTNLGGQEFLTLHIDDCKQKTTIDITTLPPGLYLVTLLSNSGDKLTRRLIRE
ncbi:MAG: hypothetical protein COA58_14380 [Bacteroidetes bacterium]|nr:MAG: hypothetical protein COA58_14380 [Bacteroidota bacterium]